MLNKLGFNEVETRYTTRESQPIKSAEMSMKHKRRKTKETPVTRPSTVADAVKETKESLEPKERKAHRITTSKKPSKYNNTGTEQKSGRF